MRSNRLTDMDFKSGRMLFSERRRRARWPWVLAPICGLAAFMFMRFDIQLPPETEVAPTPEATQTRLELPRVHTEAAAIIDATAQPEQEIPRSAMKVPAVVDHPLEDEFARAAPITEPPADELLSAAPEPELLWEVLEVRRGDSLSALFSRSDLSAGDLHRLTQADGGEALRRIHPGDEVHIRADDERRLLALRYKLREDATLIAERADQTFSVTLEETPPEVATKEAVGTISTSLFIAGRNAGLDDRLIMELAGIFGWDIDFALDIRSGDRFAVLYEELYLDGEYIRSGNILAAEFVSRGRNFRAVRHVDSDGHASYYSPEGRSMRKAFLRSPVDFHRISSHFNPNRLHPVLGTNRPHRGVDYAAPTGTPVRAAGDGRIVHLGRHGGYGNTIIIQHGSGYRTLYAHLSRYARSLKSGQRVRQGQVIGHVGMSGLATGPHLHYEFLVDGKHRDPVRVKLPDADPIPERYRDSFLAEADSLLTRLDRLQPTEFALRDDDQASR